MSRRFLPTFLALCALPTLLAAVPIRNGDRIVLLGDAIFETERHTGALELELHRRFPNTSLTLRNLSWSGDTPAGWSRASFDPASTGIQRIREHLQLTKPSVVFLGYGMAASLQELTDQASDWSLNPDPQRYGTMTVDRFRRETEALLTLIRETSGQDTRLILLSPIPHEDLRPSRPGTPDPAAHNEVLKRYSVALQEIADTHEIEWVDTPSLLSKLRASPGKSSVTSNGIHLSADSYQSFTSQLCEELGWTTDSTPAPPILREAILAKSDAFFHRYRPANATYLFGFRKHEQGNNAREMAEWDEILVAADQRINDIKNGTASPEAPPSPDPAPTPDPPLANPDFTVQDGYEITLWAEGPMVRKPVAMNWDQGGQLWVASTPIYPQIQPGRSPEDKIYVLTDQDGDGKADNSTIFADNLLIPTGIAPAPSAPGQASHACYVGASTELLLLNDTNLDGKADQQQVILSGFGTEDTHHNIHTLRWGPDGRLHLNQSIYTHSHLETPHGMVRLNAGGVLSYDPATERLEVFSRGLWNSWGHAWNSTGQSILTDGAGYAGLAWAFPGAIMNPSEGAERVMPTISPGRYPKYAGLELIDSAIFPADWQGHAITCDFRAHRIVRFELQDLETQSPKRSGYVTRELEPLIVTSDLAFRPIDVKHGPDGSLYIADWTNPIINHGEVDFRDPRRDQSNGRIWRVTRKGAPAIAWTPTTIPVARSTDPEKDAASGSPRRRIEAMRSLARTPTVANAERILDLALQNPAEDPYYEFAAWRSIRDVGPAWVSALSSGERTLRENDTRALARADLALRSLAKDQATRALAALLKRRESRPDGRGPWIEWIGAFGSTPDMQHLLRELLRGGDSEEETRARTFTALLAASKRGVQPRDLTQVKASHFQPATPDSLRLLAAWKLDYTELLASQIDGPNELRNAAFEALATLRTKDSIKTLASLLHSPNANLRRHSLGTLAGVRPDLALDSLPPIAAEMGDDPAFWRPLLAHKGFLNAFANSLPTGWSLSHYQAALTVARERGRDGRSLVRKLEPLVNRNPAAPLPANNKTVAAVIDWAKGGGDPAEGELIYRRPELACTLCHAIGGVGGKLGPDMSSLGSSAPLDYIVESLLHPERKVKEGYHAVSYKLTDGNTVVGIPTRTSASEQFIRTTTGEQAIPKSSIQSEDLAGAGASLMPGGLINSLNHMETRSLINFLQQLGRPGPFDASNGSIARLWTIHPADSPALPTAKEATPGGTALPTLIDGRVTPSVLRPLLAEVPAIFAQSRFVTTTEGVIHLKLEGIREAWVNGEPLPVASEPGRTLTLPAGTHLLTIRVDTKELPAHFRASCPEGRFLTE